MSDIPALIRTYVPLALGVLFGWLASLGINVSDEAQSALAMGIGAVLAAVYYTLVKKLEKRFPFLTVLLGSTQQPVAYAPAADETAVPALTEAADSLAAIPPTTS
jgi:hypothetical protein